MSRELCGYLSEKKKLILKINNMLRGGVEGKKCIQSMLTVFFERENLQFFFMCIYQLEKYEKN